MTADEIGGDDSAGWDPDLTRRLIDAATPLANRWFRPEVRGLKSIPVRVGHWWSPTIPAECSPLMC
jgi:hypothetical protein